MFNTRKTVLLLTLIIMGLINLPSCTAPSKVVYLYNLKDTANKAKDSSQGFLHAAQENFENLIQKNDQLWITVGGSNPADLLTLNSASGIAATGTTTQTTGANPSGYLVEADGTIKLPFLGKVKAEGMSRMQLEAYLTAKFEDYTKNPVVNVRFINYNFSVLGEVGKPGRFSMPTERTSILEAISLAGDISELGKRENVLLIREENGQRSFARINLLSKDLFTSPYFYIKTNDVIYVEPVKTRFINRSGVPQYFSIAAVAVSLLITIVNLSKR